MTRLKERVMFEAKIKRAQKVWRWSIFENKKVFANQRFEVAAQHIQDIHSSEKQCQFGATT